jgi:hypothetical protein
VNVQVDEVEPSPDVPGSAEPKLVR